MHQLLYHKLAAGLFGGIILASFFGGSPIMMLVLAGISMINCRTLSCIYGKRKKINKTL
jgi:hypothetical protein